MRRTLWMLVLLITGLVSSASAQSVDHSLWLMFPSVPAGVQVKAAQLDGEGAEELIAYHASSGTTWFVWVQRVDGAPRFCVEQATFPTGRVLEVARLHDWDGRDDVLLLPPPDQGGPLVMAITLKGQNGGACTARH